MTDGFRVDGNALAGHVRSIEQLAGRMRDIASAGRPLDLGSYGLVGRVFAGAAVAAAQAGSAVVGDLARQAAALADGVRATREAYLRAEHLNAAGFGARG